jgi:hypothetical protein
MLNLEGRTTRTMNFCGGGSSVKKQRARKECGDGGLGLYSSAKTTLRRQAGLGADTSKQEVARRRAWKAVEGHRRQAGKLPV